MAENQEDRSREDLSEEASPYRLDEFRRKGMVAQSREISGLAAMLAAGSMTYMLYPAMGAQMAEFMREIFSTDMSPRLDLGGAHVLKNIFTKAIEVSVSIGLPIALAGFVIGALASFAQIGGIFSFDPLTPDLNKINPISGIQKLFSKRQAFDAIRLVIKIVTLSLVSYAVVKSEVIQAPFSMSGDPADLFNAYGKAAAAVFFILCLILAVFAAADFGLQRLEYTKNLRLTKQEAKHEYKEREGDPQIKARIKSVQREMARRRMMQAVRKADVVVTNPTHIAVALAYDKNDMAAPKVVAKGADFIAQKIKKVAADAGVPLVENVELARALFRSVKIGQFIPRLLYQAVAEVLAYVYRMNIKKNAKGFN
ncbi:MAG: flagellar biosynthesis protein FlhB [Bdellovibrionota bacterium]|mgnify:CR=1 FL=1